MRNERERTCAMVAIPTATTQLSASRCVQLATNTRRIGNGSATSE